MPFTSEQFLDVFRLYNEAIFPAQIFLMLLAIIAVIASVWPLRYSDVTVNVVLSLLWLWMGIVYHLLYFATVNKAAHVFGAFFILQSILFFIVGVVYRNLSFGLKRDIRGMVGIVFIVFAIVVYPLLGFVLGHVYPASPTFGAPCPTTIFTIGILLLSERKLSVYIYVIPFVWSLIGATAAFSLDIREDLGLLVAGISGTALLAARSR